MWRTRTVVRSWLDSSMTPAGGRLRRRQIARRIPRGKSREDRELKSEGAGVADSFRRSVTDLLKQKSPPGGGLCEAFSKRCVETPLFVDRDHDVRAGRAREHQPR